MAKKCKDCRRSVCRCAIESSPAAGPTPKILVEGIEPSNPPFAYSAKPAYVPNDEVIQPALENANEVARLVVPEEDRFQGR
jgi:hypothetical protein